MSMNTNFEDTREFDTDDPLDFDFDDAPHRICVEIGALTVEVEGEEMDVVAETFDETFERALAETGRMSAALREARGYY
jgi:hypothetical protein